MTLPTRPTFSSAVFYDDPFAALDWLELAFGFQRTMVLTNPDGTLGHSEMTFGDGLIMVGSPWSDWTGTPASANGRNTQYLHFHLDQDIDAHHARVVAAGGEIVRPLEDQFYGDRTYAVRDPQGHVWNFGQTIRQVSREEAEAASGLAIQADGWA